MLEKKRNFVWNFELREQTTRFRDSYPSDQLVLVIVFLGWNWYLKGFNYGDWYSTIIDHLRWLLCLLSTNWYELLVKFSYSFNTITTDFILMSGTYHLLIGRLEQPMLAASDREIMTLLLPNGINGVAPELAPKNIKNEKQKTIFNIKLEIFFLWKFGF